MPKLTYQEEITKHRMMLPLYDLHPRTENAWVAPNATISNLENDLLVGEVLIRRYSSVWYNTVIRGDINRVE